MKKHLKKFNANKWGKLHGDCTIRALVLGIGIDYEMACKMLKVRCVPNEGYVAEDGNEGTGIDLDLIQETFSKFLGEIEDNLLANPDIDPMKAMLNAKPLDKWLDDKDYKNPGLYLLYLDDNKEHDGGHIVFADCRAEPKYFDISDCGDMGVQAWIKIEKRLSKGSKYHYKYDIKNHKFI